MLVVVLLLLAWLFDSWDIILFRNLALLIIVILAIFDFVRSRIYKKKITPTMDFIISCCFLTNRYSGIDGYEIGAVGKNLRNRFRMRRALRGPWGIKNKKGFYNTIKWLQEEGRNKECMQQIQQFHENPEGLTNKGILERIDERYQGIGIIAWDLCRLCNIVTWGTVAGYIKYKDAISICVKAGRILQANFNSWDDMINNYLLGYRYWCGEESKMKERKKMYEALKENPKSKLYKVDFHVYLDENDVIKQRRTFF